MSNYNGRHGPNVANYLRDLNTISPQEGSVDENFNIEGDLALFTNTEFFDFETGQNTDFQAQPVKEATHSTPSSDDVSAAPSVMGDMPNLDFISTCQDSRFWFKWGKIQGAWGLQMVGPMVQFLVMPGPLSQPTLSGLGCTASVHLSRSSGC
ncbi:uncharacterized protein CRV24_004939 [Beauveria bassiana]|nr:uncharacterized protein CRV24_004939 [Beauveria bassiana]